MTAMVPRGWCPGLYAPMPSGDGLLVRLRPRPGALTAAAARTLAQAAAAYGNGTTELTQRAAIQVRGLRAETVAPFARAMVVAGLAHPDPAREARTVRRAPLAGVGAGADPGADRGASRVADAIEAALARDPRLRALPAKFAVAVDGGGALPLGDAGADIAVACNGLCRVGLAGSARVVRCTADEAASVVAALAAAFVALAPGTPGRTAAGRAAGTGTGTGAWAGVRRMRALVAALGADAVFARAGLVAEAAPRCQPPPATAADRIGWIAVGGGAPGAFGAGLPFGLADPALLRGLAELAGRFGDGALRPVARGFVLAGVDPGEAPALAAALAALGLIVAAGDPRLRLVACPGRPACAGAFAAVREDAALLAALDLPGITHVSGCAKGCAHPGPAARTLVATAEGYAIVRDGRAADPPGSHVRRIADAIDALRGAA